MTTQWIDRPESGSPGLQRLMLRTALMCGRTCARGMLLPVVGYFLLKRGPERRASRLYLCRALGRRPALADIARHFYTMAAVTLDRAYLLTESFRRFDVKIEGLDALERALAPGRGALLFGSHLGCFDALRLVAERRPDIPVRVVIDLAQNPGLSELLSALNPGLAATVIDASQDSVAVALAIAAALQGGVLVAMPADRLRPGNTAQLALFLGKEAPFPVAPWHIASLMGVPVVIGFGLYRGGNRYELAFEYFADTLAAKRSERDASLAGWIRLFADRLSFHARRAPYNWFNFYDFWNSDDAPVGKSRDVDVLPGNMVGGG